jgi:hypothetical protein
MSSAEASSVQYIRDMTQSCDRPHRIGLTLGDLE